jgi:hypothetical protein
MNNAVESLQHGTKTKENNNNNINNNMSVKFPASVT